MKMKEKWKKVIEIIIESINFIIITYALSSMAMSFRTSPLYILFFASNVWLIGRYGTQLQKITGSRVLTAIIFCLSFGIFCFIAYFVGYIDGNIVQFNK